MTTSIQASATKLERERTGALDGLPKGLDSAALIRAFRTMYLSRCLDNREILLKRQSKIFFQVSAAGHEAIQTAAGMALRPGYDWTFGYYRDRALALALGVTAEDMLLQALGAARDSASGGRQMPSHWSSPSLHIFTGSSPTGTQFVQAAGCAQAKRYTNPDSDEITLVSSGEGATSEGEFWECINAACLEKLPLLVLIEDNGFAISVPVERQSPGGNVSRLLQGFPGLLRIEADGTNFVDSFQAVSEAAEYCRAGHGPALVHATCTRPYSHSLSDDERSYKSQCERDEEASRDPLALFPRFLLENNVLDRAELDRLTAEIDSDVARITDRVLREKPPARDTVLLYLYSDKVDPSSSGFDRQPRFRGEPRTMIDSINLTLAEEMRRDQRRDCIRRRRRRLQPRTKPR